MPHRLHLGGAELSPFIGTGENCRTSEFAKCIHNGTALIEIAQSHLRLVKVDGALRKSCCPSGHSTSKVAVRHGQRFPRAVRLHGEKTLCSPQSTEE